MLGTCRLCAKSPVELKRSHILPKWAYRRARNVANSDPALVRHGIAKQTSWQWQEYLLCGDCEDKLSVREKYVAELCYDEHGVCPLFSEIGVTPGSQGAEVRRAALDRVDRQALRMFGASVVWRSHVSGASDRVSLGVYGEEFRRFLNGDASFPGAARLALWLLDHSDKSRDDARNLVIFPVTARYRTCHVHLFYAHGLCFEIYVGKRVPGDLENRAIQADRCSYVNVASLEHISLVRAAKQQILSSKESPRLTERRKAMGYE